jgi:peroxiredoxin
MAEYKRCPKCSADNFTFAQFCARCGYSFEKPNSNRVRTCAISCVAVLAAFSLCVCALVIILMLFPSDLDQDEQLAEIPANATPTVGVKLGQIAPDFALRDSSGRTTSLAGLRGKPILLNFWASWCGPCRSEMSDLNALYTDASARQGLIVLAVNTGDKDRAGAESFIRKQGLRFPILWDESNQVNKQYNIRAIPTSFFIDRTGLIHAIRVGSMSRKDMDARAQLIY